MEALPSTRQHAAKAARDELVVEPAVYVPTPPWVAWLVPRPNKWTRARALYEWVESRRKKVTSSASASIRQIQPSHRIVGRPQIRLRSSFVAGLRVYAPPTIH